MLSPSIIQIHTATLKDRVKRELLCVSLERSGREGKDILALSTNHVTGLD